MNVDINNTVKEVRESTGKGILAVGVIFWSFLIVGCAYPLVQMYVYDIGMVIPAEVGDATDTLVWGMVLSIAMLAFTVRVARREYEWAIANSLLTELSLADYVIWACAGALLLYLQYSGHFGEPKWVHWMRTTLVIALFGFAKIQTDRLVEWVLRGRRE